MRPARSRSSPSSNERWGGGGAPPRPRGGGAPRGGGGGGGNPNPRSDGLRQPGVLGVLGIPDLVRSDGVERRADDEAVQDGDDVEQPVPGDRVVREDPGEVVVDAHHVGRGHRLARQHRHQTGMCREGVTIGPEQHAYLLDPVAVGPAGDPGHVAEDQPAHRLDDLRLARDVVVERGRPDLQHGRDLRDRELTVAVHQPQRGLGDQLGGEERCGRTSHD